MRKKFAGYINLKPLNGVIYPSYIQNILMKNFIENHLGGMFYLSPTEVLQAKYSITLKTLISKETNVSGIVMLSSFLLPNNYKERESVYKRLIISRKKMFFILDELSLEKKQDIEKIEDFIIFNSKHFIDTKKKLSAYESLIMKQYKDVSFV